MADEKLESSVVDTTNEPQHTGVSGTVVDAAAASAADDLAWWQKTVVYEIYPKSFQDTRGQGVGTIRGVIEHLDYLQKLGVGAIWLTPVYPSPMRDNGYDVADYRDINPEFGTMADMEDLIAEAGERDIRVVMDLVLNHSSDQHPWFLESSSCRDNPKADWYVWADPRPDGSAPANWRAHFGGQAWNWCEARQQYYLGSFAPFQPDFNWENPELRQALYDIARFWLAKGVGGFRLDAMTYIKKAPIEDWPPDGPDGLRSLHDIEACRPGILDFLREFRRETIDGTNAFTVAEAAGVKAEDLKDWVGPDGAFSMLIEYNHIHAIRGNTPHWYERPGWVLPDLTRAISASQRATAETGWCCVYLESHDNPRSPNSYFPFVERYPEEAKLLGLVLLTLRGTPFLYQGEELGMTNERWSSIDAYDDVEMKGQYALALESGLDPKDALWLTAEYSRDNARSPMQWTPGENAGFTTGHPWLPVHADYRTVNAESEEADATSVLNWYRHLIYVRKKLPLLLAGSYRELLPGHKEIFAFERELGHQRAVTIANFSNEKTTYDPELVAGLVPHTSSAGYPETVVAGTLRPLEAVLYVSPQLAQGL